VQTNNWLLFLLCTRLRLSVGVNDVNSVLRALASLEHEISDGNDDHDDGHYDGPVLSHCFLHITAAHGRQ